MTKRPRRRGIVVVVVLLVGAVLGVGALWLVQRSLIYFPDDDAPPPAAEALPGARDVTLRTEDGLDLGAWYLPAAESCGGTVLVAQGNAGTRAGRAELGRAIGELGLGVLLFDYRGYAGNPGNPSEDGLARDVRAARDFLTGAAGVPDGALVYFGESLGTGVVVELAAEHPPAAMLLRSPFTSLADAARALYRVPVGPLLRDRYPVREGIAQLDAPVAVVYGGADTLVPAEQSRSVARTARDVGAEVIEVEVAGAGHNDPELARGPRVMAALADVARLGGIDGCG